MFRTKKSPLRATPNSQDSKARAHSPVNFFGRRSAAKVPRIAPRTPHKKSQMEFRVQHHSPGTSYPSQRVYTPETPQKNQEHHAVNTTMTRRVIAPIKVNYGDYGFTRKRKSLSVHLRRIRQQLRHSTGLDIEALHIIARPLMIAAGYAPEAAANLVMGTRQANSSMMSFENALQRLIKEDGMSPWIWATVDENQAGLGDKLILFVSLQEPGELSDKGKPLDPQCRYYQISFNLQLNSEPALACETYCYQALKDKFFPPKTDVLSKSDDSKPAKLPLQSRDIASTDTTKTLVLDGGSIPLEAPKPLPSLVSDKVDSKVRTSRSGLFSEAIRRKLDFSGTIVNENQSVKPNTLADEHTQHPYPLVLPVGLHG